MTTSNDPSILSGAAHVEETEHLASGLTMPMDTSVQDPSIEGDVGQLPLETELTSLTLSMFIQGSSTRVRVGNPRNASEFYEYAYDSVDEANTAMIDGGILTSAQVTDMSQPAGLGILLEGISVEQLEAAGLKRHSASTL